MSRFSGTGAILLALAGCASPGDPVAAPANLPLAVLQSQDQCGGLSRPTVRWIVDPGEWRTVYAQIHHQWMTPPPPPAVDFPRDGVLLIAMGQQSSSGYGLTLADERATVRDGVLTVRVNWREPAPSRRRAQVITTPCLLATLPDAGFTRIQIVDQQGRQRLEGKR